MIYSKWHYLLTGASIDLYGILIAILWLKRTEEGRDHTGSHNGKGIHLYGWLDVRIICITIKEKVGKFNLACISSLFEVGRICGVWKKEPKHLTLNDWSGRERRILFPENLNASPRRTKANFEKRAEIPATTSGHLWSRATAVNISLELFPAWRQSFRNVARSWHLAGNSFIARCPVTIN